MKKITMLFTAALLAMSAHAQRTAITSSKAQDNIYVGINGGANAPVTNYRVFHTITPEFGLRAGKNFTTVFGLAVEADMHFYSSPYVTDTKTFIDNTNISLLGTANMMNLIGGYLGSPRPFEITALGGFGWYHIYGIEEKSNSMTSTFALDFALNFGDDNEWQVYVEPSITYNMRDYLNGVAKYDEFQYNVNKAKMGLKVGVNYKLMCSNGKHNFTREILRDQNEINELNAKIDELRNECAAKDIDCENTMEAKDAEIARLKQALAGQRPVQIVKSTANLQPTVIFGLGKSIVEKSQEASVSLIANYMKSHKKAKVRISGYASPEGDRELNQKLSESRANAVRDMLVDKYGIAPSRLEAVGLGATDKLFEEVEFNRVATFTDITK